MNESRLRRLTGPGLIGRVSRDTAPTICAEGDEVLIYAGGERPGEDFAGLLLTPASARAAALGLANVADDIDRDRAATTVFKVTHLDLALVDEGPDRIATLRLHSSAMSICFELDLIQLAELAAALRVVSNVADSTGPA